MQAAIFEGRTSTPYCDADGNPMVWFPETGTNQLSKSRTVISVAPIAYKKRYTYYGSPIYVIPAAPAGGHSKIKVYAHQVWQMDRNSISDDNPRGSHSLLPMPETAVAKDFVAFCTNGNLGASEGVHPGVALCASEEPTQDEISRCFADHQAYARWVCNDARKLFQNAEHKSITEEHRRQAKWLGLSRLDAPWMVLEERVETKECKACGNIIKSSALKCGTCQTLLPDFYEQLGLDPADDPAVAAIMAQRRAARQAPIAPPLKPTAQKN